MTSSTSGCATRSSACSRARTSNGAFGLWSVGGDDMWLNAYVTDFLTRARERGFAVPPARLRPRARALAQLRRQHDRGRSQRRRSRLCGLCAGPQRPAGDGRSALSRRHQDRGLRHAAGAGRRSAPRSALLGDRGRSQSVFGGGGRAAARHARRPASIAPITARAFATAPACWRSSPRPASRASRSSRSARVIEEERGSNRTHQHAGERLDGPGRAGALARDAEAIAISVDGTPRKGVALPHLPRRRRSSAGR